MRVSRKPTQKLNLGWGVGFRTQGFWVGFLVGFFCIKRVLVTDRDPPENGNAIIDKFQCIRQYSTWQVGHTPAEHNPKGFWHVNTPSNYHFHIPRSKNDNSNEFSNS